MKRFLSGDRPVAALVMFVAGLWLMPSMVAAQQKYIVKPVAEMKVKQLPKGELFWRVESFRRWMRRRPLHHRIAGIPDTVSYDGLPSLAAEAAGKAWLFTLGPKGGVNGGRNEGCGDRTGSSAQRARVSVACELRPRAAGFDNTGAYASRLRNHSM